eukprot:9386741-Pyramimonas_sp.AAC.1
MQGTGIGSARARDRDSILSRASEHMKDVSPGVEVKAARVNKGGGGSGLDAGKAQTNLRAGPRTQSGVRNSFASIAGSCLTTSAGKGRNCETKDRSSSNSTLIVKGHNRKGRFMGSKIRGSILQHGNESSPRVEIDGGAKSEDKIRSSRHTYGRGGAEIAGQPHDLALGVFSLSAATLSQLQRISCRGRGGRGSAREELRHHRHALEPSLRPA